MDTNPHISGSLLISDIFRPEIASMAVNDFNVNMINDISGGDMDTGMYDTVAGLQVPYVMMHMKGKPSDMQEHADYEDVVKEIILGFSEKLGQLNKLGVNDIIIDPGFGFANLHEERVAQPMDIASRRRGNLPSERAAVDVSAWGRFPAPLPSWIPACRGNDGLCAGGLPRRLRLLAMSATWKE